MSRTGRRAFLAGTAAGTACLLAGCQFLSNSTVAEAGGAEWQMSRGTRRNTGASTSGGPSADATAASTLEMEDGIATGRHAPLVGDDGVYAIGREASPYSHDPFNFSMYAYKFDPASGSKEWQRTVVEAEGTENDTAVREMRASLGDGVVYVAWIGDTDDEEYVEHLAALDRADGSTRWNRTFGQSATVTEPVVVDETLYRVSGGTMKARDVTDGSRTWQSDDYMLSRWGHPAVGDDVVVGLSHQAPEGESESGLAAFDRGTGEVVWTADITTRSASEPTIHDGTVFVTEGDSIFLHGVGDPENAQPRRLYAFDASDGSERWSFQYDTDAMADKYVAGGTSFVTVDSDHAYIALGFANAKQILGPSATEDRIEEIRPKLYHGPNVFALDRQSGDVAWKTQVGDQAQSVHPPIVDDETLYVTRISPDGEAHDVHVLDRTDGSEMGSFGPIERDAEVGVANGALYAHDRSKITVWRDG